MNKFRNLMSEKMLVALSSMSIVFAATAARSLCLYFFHQPKAPSKLRDLKK